MKAQYAITTIKALNNHRRRILIHAATREQDDNYTRAARLKAFTFCTDAVKFEVLSQSDKVSQELYDDLYQLYFGTVQDGDQDKEEQPNMEEQHKIHWTDELTTQLIEAYNSGLRGAALADQMGIKRTTVMSHLQKLKVNPKYKEMFNMNQTTTSTEPTTENETENEAAAQTDTPTPDSLPKSFSAYGSGFITTDGGLKLDEEPLLTALRQAIMEKGLRQFYGEVTILITPKDPTGMTVSVEE